jgi:tRNA nucleotidyltransferase (CCA-adding enzyme)
VIAEVLNRPGLRRVREIMNQRGFDIRIVGGAVRSHLLGVEAADIDLCTDADPDEQIAIYKAADLRYIETGLQHGTITVVIPGEDHYEITSLRMETDHDGRHATVRYTRDWFEDLGRRDLTVNAMAMTFDGEVIDPFGGAKDLAERRVRFVGEPAERMREDYLRILRWLRFHGRIAGNHALDHAASAAARQSAAGLAKISRERVWMEMSKIVSGPSAPMLFGALDQLGLLDSISLPRGDLLALGWARGRGLKPPTLMAAYLGYDAEKVSVLAADWRWSLDEYHLARFVCQNIRAAHLDYRRMMTLQQDLSDAYRRSLRETAKARIEPGEAAFIETFVPPKCPVSGDDLITLGMKPGPQLGKARSLIRDLWYEAGCPTSREDGLRLCQRIVDEAAQQP